MVGTFYTAAKPGEKPFVGVGSRVVADETDVCVIEAMKNFFVQKADVSGTIVKILVENGQPVQVEQPMFLVRRIDQRSEFRRQRSGRRRPATLRR